MLGKEKLLQGCTAVSGPQQNMSPGLSPLVLTQNGSSSAQFLGAPGAGSLTESRPGEPSCDILS